MSLFGADSSREVLIMEPCNYASNIAYYHSAVRFCDYPDWHMEQDTIFQLKRAMTTLASGSSHLHGSHTVLGMAFDNNVISVLAYVSYQSLLDALGGSDEPALKCVANVTECLDADQVTDRITQMPLNLPVEKWMAEFDDLMGQYQFRYFYTFAALWIIIFQLSLPQYVSTPTLRFLLE